MKTEPSEEERKKEKEKRNPMKTEPNEEERGKKKSVGQKLLLSGSLMCV